MDNESECDFNLITQSNNKCFYTQTHCNNQSKIAFTQHFYCIANENYLFLILLIPITLYIIFHSLQRTAELYLSPGITKIANHFQMSQTLAGVTIIAFANGAPDMITAFVAINETKSGLLIAIGSIFGSGFIMTTIIIGAIQYFSINSLINRASLIRDIIFNLLGICVIFYFGYKGSIQYQETFFYIFLYSSYITVVLINKYSEDKQFENNKKQNEKNLTLEECEGLLNDENEQIEISHQPLQQQDTSKIYSYNQNQEKAEEFEEQYANHSINVSFEDEKEEKFMQLSLIEKFEKVITFFTDLIIDHSIFQSKVEKNQFKYKFYINIFISPIIMIYLLELEDVMIGSITILMIPIIFSLKIVFLDYLNNQNIQTKLQDLLSNLSILQSVLWCKFFVEILIDLIILIQTLTGLSHSYLGMTFLAIGNSACDFFVNTELAKKGLGIMATTGCYSGAFFNANIGLGLALLFKCANENISFELFSNSSHDLINHQTKRVVQILLVALFINLFITLMLVLLKKFKLKRNLSYYYFSYYAIVLCLITSITFGFFNL